jgi:hypothetical protein
MRGYPSFYEDVPADIVAADTSGGHPLRDTAPDPHGERIARCVSTELIAHWCASL